MTLTKDCFEISELVRNRFKQSVSNRITESALLDIVDFVHEVSETKSNSYRERFPLCDSIDCKKGCSHCCHMRIHVTVPEVLRLHNYIVNQFSTTEIEELLNRLRDVVLLYDKTVSDEEYGCLCITCPMLVNDSCSVYPNRPIECQGYVSTKLSACKVAQKNYSRWKVPIDDVRYTLHKSAQVGILTAIVEIGYEPELLELNRATLIALEHTNPAEEWASKEPIFQPARIIDGDSEIEAMKPWSSTIEDWTG